MGEAWYEYLIGGCKDDESIRQLQVDESIHLPRCNDGIPTGFAPVANDESMLEIALPHWSREPFSNSEPCSMGGSLDGTWTHGSGTNMIKGKMIYWEGGEVSNIMDVCADGFETVFEGTKCRCRLEDGRLRWSNGALWERADLLPSLSNSTLWERVERLWSGLFVPGLLQDLAAQEEGAGLEGIWLANKGMEKNRISGSKIFWDDGRVTDIEETCEGKFTTVFDDSVFLGHLSLGGLELRWSDGDTWMRFIDPAAALVERLRPCPALLGVVAVVVADLVFILGVAHICQQLPSTFGQSPPPESKPWPEWRVWWLTFYWLTVPLLVSHGVCAVLLVRRGSLFRIFVSPSLVDDGQRSSAGVAQEPAFLWLLEPMRLAAVMHIFTYHEHPSSPLGRWGFAWISFFFVLSGFVGGYQLLMHDPGAQRTTVLRHVVKRIRRLWPLYLLFVFIMSVPRFFEDSLDKGIPFPTLQGSVAAIRKLFCLDGLLYICGLQTLVPLDSSFTFVNRTCWFVPTLLLCEAPLPIWLRGIYTLLQSGAVGSLESKRGPSLRGLLVLACLLTSASSLSVAVWKEILRLNAWSSADLQDSIFWVLRFGPMAHWPQVLLGAVLAVAFVQASGPKGTCQDESLTSEAAMRGVRWFLGATCILILVCLVLYMGTDNESNATLLFLNDGAPASSFAALVFSAAMISLECPVGPLLKKIAQITGSVVFPAYLFVPHAETLLYTYFVMLHCSPGASLSIAHWLRIPFLAFVQVAIEKLAQQLRVWS